VADELIKALLPMVLAGPPAPPPLEARQMVGRLEEPAPESIWPLVASQLADLASTEAVLRRHPNASEGDPLPGMGSSLGRIGWNVLEAALVDHFTKKKPGLRKAMINTLPVGHGTLAAQNATVASAPRYHDPYVSMWTPAGKP
jgi:hypothetical protein